MVVDIASVQAEEHEVAIFVINDLVEQYMLEKKDKRVKTYLLRRQQGSRNPLPLLMLNIKLWQFKPDVINHHSNGASNAIFVCKRVPIVRTSHGLMNVCDEFRKFSKVIAISETVRDDMAKGGVKSVVIHNGIRTSLVSTVRNNPFTDGKVHIVQVSRLHIETKAQDVVINAVEILKKKGVTGFVMHFIGNGPDEDVLHEMVVDKGLDDVIVFEGRVEQSEIYKMLANFDLFVQASRQEGFGLTIAEAMAAKVPVLVSDISAPMEVIDNGRLGAHFHNEDAEGLAKQIELFLQNGRNEKQIEEAWQFVVDHYDVKLTAGKYIDEYKKLMI